MTVPPRRVPVLLRVALVLAVVLVLLVLARQDAYFSFDRNDLSQLVLLVAILAFVGAGLFGRGLRPGEIFRGLVAWTAVILLLVGLYANREQLVGVAGRVLGAIAPGVPISGRLAGEVNADSVVVTRSADGHFAVLGSAEEKPVLFLVDTGASFVTLSQEDALKAGFDPGKLSYDLSIRTANGSSVGAPIEIARLAIGPIVRRNVRALVAPPGALDQSLLGMSFLDSLTSYSVSGDRLVLKP